MGARLAGLLSALMLLAACAGTASEAGDEAGDGAGDGASSETPSISTTTPTPSSTPSLTTTSRPTEPTPTGASGPRGTRVILVDSDFGPMLFGADGQAIYLFDLESTSQPRCHDECAAAWPPVLTTGEPVAGDGVRAALLGRTRRDDGSTQVTYGGHPLYFYAHEDPWQVLCHDFFDYGGTWFVVQPDGAPAP